MFLCFLFPIQHIHRTQQQKQKSRSIFHQFSPSLSEARLGSQHSNIVGCRNKYITYEEPSTFTEKKAKRFSDFSSSLLSYFSAILKHPLDSLLLICFCQPERCVDELQLNRQQSFTVWWLHTQSSMGWDWELWVNVEGEKIISLMDTTTAQWVCEFIIFEHKRRINLSRAHTTFP